MLGSAPIAQLVIEIPCADSRCLITDPVSVGKEEIVYELFRCIKNPFHGHITRKINIFECSTIGNNKSIIALELNWKMVPADKIDAD